MSVCMKRIIETIYELDLEKTLSFLCFHLIRVTCKQ